MPDPIRINDLVALRDALPAHDLTAGRIGCVRMLILPDAYAVEFTDQDGEPVTTLSLKAAQFSVLRHEATLDEDTFWQMVETAKAGADGDGERQVALLTERLAAMSVADIFAYDAIFDRLHSAAYHWDLWAACYIIGGGCSDDSFTDFREWLVAQGRQIYADALHDPETLVDVVPLVEHTYGRWGDAELEDMNYVAPFAYEMKTGEEIPAFRGLHTLRPIGGERWSEETVYRKYPRLTRKFQPYMYKDDGRAVD